MVAEQVHVVTQSEITREAWDNVSPARWRSPKLLYAWAKAMASHYSRIGALSVVVVGPLSEPKALLAMTVEPGFLNRHEFVANDDGGLSVPRVDDSVLPALAKGLISLGKPADLGYYPADDAFIGEVQKAARGKAKVMIRAKDIPAAPWLDLDESWSEPTNNLRRNMRQSLRRNERRIKELGELTVDFIEPGADTVDGLLDIAVAVEAKSWKERTGTALTHDHKQQAFFRDYAKVVADEGRLHVAFLRLDGEAVAMSIGEIHENIFWAYKIGYDEAVAKFGPGALMQYYLIGHLAARGIQRIEMQGHLLEYKKNWTDKAIDTVAVRVYPYNPRGVAAMGYDAIRQFVKRREARQEAAARAAKSEAAKAKAQAAETATKTDA